MQRDTVLNIRGNDKINYISWNFEKQLTKMRGLVLKRLDDETSHWNDPYDPTVR
jgi:glutathione peroxidase-family protein